MNIYIELLLVAAIVVYVVDLSGWTDTWLGWLSRFTAAYGRSPVRSLRPFSCSLCMVWWTGLVWAALRGGFTLPVVAYCAALSFFSNTLVNILIFIKETLTGAIAKLDEWINAND